MATHNMIKVLELSNIAPPPGSVSEASLPLTFFDITWVQLPPIQRLFFYEFSPPNTSTCHFLNSILPNLKTSLSLAIQLFYPLAGNLTLSPKTGEHEIRYAGGDSISLTVAESSTDFHRLVANHPKDAAELHPLISTLANTALLALQITVFPDAGFCIGITLHHVIADGRSLAHFMKSWATICRTGDGSSITSLPIYDRSLIQDPKGLKRIYSDDMAGIEVDKNQEALHVTTQVHLVRATIVLGRARIEKLRQWVLGHRPELLHCTPFVLACAYVWVCLLKARGDDGDKTVYFTFPMDCRARLDPPIPATYFGNCIGLCYAEAKRSDLVKEDGVATASESISRAIRGLGEGVLNGAEGWMKRYVQLAIERVVSVAGSPKFRIYDTDFGGGRPRKTEVLSIEKTGAFCLGESRYEEGGTEVGLALPKCEMDAFASLFEEGLLKNSDKL